MSAFRTAWTHLISQIFVATTGLGALIHSTWALGTLFSGVQPASPPIGADAADWISFLVNTAAWHIPAFSIAFAMDVGQIVTSHEIRQSVQRGETPTAKYVTFAVFAVATYYLQWMYCIHHIPMLELGAGVSAQHAATVGTLKDMAVWIVPALLPLSTLLYTLSYSSAQGDHAQTNAVQPVHKVQVSSWSKNSTNSVQTESNYPENPNSSMQLKVERPATPALPASAASAPRTSPTGNYTGEASNAVQETADGWLFTCPRCGATKTYAEETSAVKGAAAHIGRYCKAPVEVQS